MLGHLFKFPTVLVSTITLVIGAAGIVLSVGLFHADTGKIPLPTYTLPRATSVAPNDTSIVDGATQSAHTLQWKEVAKQVGLDSRHQQSSSGVSSLIDALSGAACVIDINEDQWPDLIHITGDGDTRHYGRQQWWAEKSGVRLFLNQQGNGFRDVTASMTAIAPTTPLSCAVADLNNDGRQDLIITSPDGLVVYRNDAGIGFTEMLNTTDLASAQSRGLPTGVWFADYDRDGLVDLYVTRLIVFDKRLNTFERGFGYANNTSRQFDPTLYAAADNQLLRNTGNFVLQDVTVDLSAASHTARSFGAKWVDLNNDQWLDLIVLNGAPDGVDVLINQAGQRFVVDNDRYDALKVNHVRSASFVPTVNTVSPALLMVRGPEHPLQLIARDGNLSADGPGLPSRQDSARSLSLSGWGAISADLNNDALSDIYVARGRAIANQHAPYLSQAQPNQAWMSTADATVQAVSEQQLAFSSRGVLVADFNRDGQLELVVANNNGPLQYFRLASDNKRQWNTLGLSTEFSDADYFGATVTVHQQNNKRVFVLDSSQTFMAQGERRLHLGLGHDRIDAVQIKLASGWHSTIRDLPANHHVTVNQTPGTYWSRAAGATPTSGTTPTQLLASLSVLQDRRSNVDLLVLWRQSNARSRVTMLDAIDAAGQFDHNAGLLDEALLDSDVGVVKAAINYVRALERYDAGERLVPLLEHDDVQVKCSAAAAFEHFFNEEEAVVHTKWLAIKPLIRLLQSAEESEAVCAANALAAAEHRAALAPLRQLVQHSSNESIRVAAINSLGQIRDTSVRSILLSVIQDQHTKARVKAHALVALQRIGLAQSNLTSRQLADELINDAQSSALHRLELALALKTHGVPVVYDDGELDQIIDNLIDAQITRFSDDPDEVLKQWQIVLGAIRTIAGEQYAVVTTPLFLHDNTTVRSEALLTGVALGAEEQTSALVLALRLLSQTDLMRLIDRFSTLDKPLHPAQVKMLSRLSSDASTQHQINLAVLKSLPAEQSSNYLAQLLGSPQRSTEELTSLLSACQLRPRLSDQTMHQLIKVDEVEVRLALVQCMLNHDRGLDDVTAERVLKIRLVASSLLNDSRLSDENQQQLLVSIAKKDRFLSRLVVVPNLDRLKGQNLKLGLRHLRKWALARETTPFLTRLLRDETQHFEHRLQAAISLMSGQPLKAIARMP